MYTVEHTPPTVASIVIDGSSPNNASTDQWTVTFSEPVTGVSASDFGLGATGSASATVTSVTGSGTTYMVTAGAVSGDGTLGLWVVDAAENDVHDLAGNAFSQNIFAGQKYTVQLTPPTVSWIALVGSSPNNAGSDQFTVEFSEPVTGVDASDFTAATTGTASGTVASVTGSGTTYTVTVGSVAGDGTLELDLNGSGTGIMDAVGNPIGGGFTDGGVYTVRCTSPTVSSIDLVGPAANNAGSDQFVVTFSESVTGVDASDFSLTTTGTASGTVASITGSGSTYTVTVGSVTGEGTLRLDLNASGTGIEDPVGNAISGGYLAGQTYTIERTGPSNTSITVPADGTYGAGQWLQVTLAFSAPVFVTGTPRIAIGLAAGHTVYANYTFGSGTGAITFRYTVAAGDRAPSGITLASSVDLNGGTIADAAGNAAPLALTGTPSTAGVDVGTGGSVTTTTTSSPTTSSTTVTSATSDTATTTTATTSTSVTGTSNSVAAPVAPHPPRTNASACRRFAVGSVAPQKAPGTLRVGLTVTCAGAVRLLEARHGSAWGGALPPASDVIASLGRTLPGAGRVVLLLAPSAPGLRALEHARRMRGAALADLWITFTPSGGPPSTQSRTGSARHGVDARLTRQRSGRSNASWRACASSRPSADQIAASFSKKPSCTSPVVNRARQSACGSGSAIA